MESLMLRVSGNWAHFKKPETNNNPLTHDLITKTALIGMMGAVLGIEREQMRPLFPQFSEDLVYGVAVEAPVKKQSWAFTLRRFDKDRSRLEVSGLSPRPFEFLRTPCFRVTVAIRGEISSRFFHEFVELTADQRTHYEPVLGLHNCPAELKLLGTGQADIRQGEFETPGFVPRALKPKPAVNAAYRMGFERLPTFQNSDMWNPPERYVDVIYADAIPQEGAMNLSGVGAHFAVRIDKGAEEFWCLI